jgi:adenylate kinase
MKEFEYQSSLELATETYDVINRIPLAELVGLHARQQLVRRLGIFLLLLF